MIGFEFKFYSIDQWYILVLKCKQMAIQYTMHDKKQIKHNLMHQLIQILTMLLVLNVLYQTLPTLQVFGRVVISEIIFIFEVQCKIILLFIFEGMTSIIVNLIEISLIASSLDGLAIIYCRIGSNLAKINKIECINGNASNVTMIIIDISQASCAGLEIAFFLDVICFILETMDASIRNIIVSVFIIAIIRLESNLAILSTFGAVDCGTLVTHNVCCVFYYVCLLFLLIFEFVNVLLSPNI